jgi:hypothetical protein
MSTNQIAETSNVEIVYGHGDSDLTIFSQGFIFLVHREVICQASEVWRAMLTGEFAESFKETVTLHDDDSNALKMVLDILYGQLATGGTEELSTSSLTTNESGFKKLLEVADKYDLKGVVLFVENARKVFELEKTIRQLQQDSYMATYNHENALNRVKSRLKTRGNPVNICDFPPIGTRVTENFGNFVPAVAPKSGRITSISEDNNSEIAVCWDDGTESHNLQCGKKNRYVLNYA